MAANLNTETISQITEAEKNITGQDGPVKGGPTAEAQKHVGQPIDRQTLHNITEGEKKITGGERVKGGPTSTAQSIVSKSNNADQTGPSGQNTSTNASISSNKSSSGVLDSATLGKIAEAEKNITGQNHMVKGGPTAKAQSHAGEVINSENLSDITAGEKEITGGERVKGGPTATIQSELGRSRS